MGSEEFRCDFGWMLDWSAGGGEGEVGRGGGPSDTHSLRLPVVCFTFLSWRFLFVSEA